MKTFTLFCLGLSGMLFAQGPKLETSEKWLYFDVPAQVLIGYIDEKGKEFICTNTGKCKRTNRKGLIKHILASDMDERVRSQALTYLGHPINMKIYGIENTKGK